MGCCVRSMGRRAAAESLHKDISARDDGAGHAGLDGGSHDRRGGGPIRLRRARQDARLHQEPGLFGRGLQGPKTDAARLEPATAAADPAVRRQEYCIGVTAGGFPSPGLGARYARPRSPRNQVQAQVMRLGLLVPVHPLLQQIKIRARTLKRDVHAIYLAARSPRVPWHVKIIAIAVAGYALSPIDLIPDFIPVLGYVDDLILVPLGIWLVILLIPAEIMAEHRAIASEAAQSPRGKVAAIVIVAIWIVAMIAMGWLGFAHWRRPT